MGNYYVIQVYTGAEQKTVENIKKNLSAEAAVDCFYVVRRRKKKYTGTWHLIEENCFPGYVFIESENPRKMIEELSSLRVFARILGMDKETFYVQSIDERERIFIDKLTNRDRDKRTIDVSEIRLEEGKQVEIVSGPLRGFEGKVKKYDFHHRRATIEINILGNVVRTDVGIEFLKTNDNQ